MLILVTPQVRALRHPLTTSAAGRLHRATVERMAQQLPPLPPREAMPPPGDGSPPTQQASDTAGAELAGLGGDGGTPTPAPGSRVIDHPPQPSPLTQRGIAPTPAKTDNNRATPTPKPKPKSRSTVAAAQSRLQENALDRVLAEEWLAENSKDDAVRLKAIADMNDRTPGMAKGTVVSVEHRFVTDPRENHEALRRVLSAAGAIDAESWPVEDDGTDDEF